MKSITHSILSAIVLTACTHQGSFRGEIERPADAVDDEQAEAPADDRVLFTWESDPGLGGTIAARLPSGERLTGEYYEITRATRVAAIDGFYRAWYGGPWGGPGWGWGAWPYYGTPDAYLTHYSGEVVALLDSDQGTSMRCHFSLFTASVGMRGGGEGECQLSNGEQVTAIFPPT